MKRLICATFCTVLIISLCACSDSPQKPAVTAPQSKVVATNNKQPEPAVVSKKYTWPPKSSGIAPDPDKVNYYIVFDNSGSMADFSCDKNSKKSDSAKRVIENFVRKINPGSNVGVAIFDETSPSPYYVDERVPLGINNRDAIASKVKASKPSGGTPLYNAVHLGLKSLENQADVQLGFGVYNLIIVTDGEANQGQDPSPVIDFISENTPIVTYVVGFCLASQGSRHSLDKPGKTKYFTANSELELNKILQQILQSETDTFK